MAQPLLRPLLAAIVLLVLTNLFFFTYIYTGQVETPFSVSSSKDSSYYVIEMKSEKNSELSKLLENHEPMTEDGAFSKLKNLIQSDGSGEIIASVQKLVEAEYKPKYIEELREKVNEDYTKQLFSEKEKSYQVWLHLKAEYYEQHAEELKQSVEGSLKGEYDKKYDRKQYFNFLLDLIVAEKPESAKISSLFEGRAVGGHMYFQGFNPGYSRKFLTEHRVRLPEGGFEDLQNHHDSLVSSLKALEAPPDEIFKGDGIVVNGGGIYLTGSLIVIVQLRELGSKLPIELVVNTESEYDKHICENVLPRFDAKCKVIERELGPELYQKLNVRKFQLKTIGFLISSFDNIISLDADNLPIKNPDFLLYSEPFISTKWILWPDIWHKGTSPLYYDIARFKVGEPVRREGLSNQDDYSEYIKKNKDSEIWFHDLDGVPPAMSTESGQMVFSKKAHLKSLLLAIYYNVHGYSHYYKLLYQGTFGLGDRDTFIPALHVMNEPYTLNRYHVWFAGYDKTNGEGKVSLEESTMVQHDPQQSEQFFLDWSNWLKEQKLDTRLWPFQDNKYTSALFERFKGEQDNYKLPDALFLHVHKPKINPVQNDQEDVKHQFKDELYKRRFLGVPGKYDRDFGTKVDWELKFNSIAKWVVCTALDSDNFWNNIAHDDKSTVCKQITNFVELLKKDTNNIDDAKLAVDA